MAVPQSRPERDDDVLVFRDWAGYLPYLRLSRDRKRSRLPQVSLYVDETRDLFEGWTLAERGLFVALLLEAASRPLVENAQDAAGTRRLTRASVVRAVREFDANGLRVLARLLERGCVAFCPANDRRLSAGAELSRAGLSRAERSDSRVVSDDSLEQRFPRFGGGSGEQ